MLEYARATKAVPRLMSAVAPTLSLEETYARITPRGSRRGSLSSLIDAPGRADSPARGEDADGAGIPPAWRELARLSRDVAASGGSGGGKAAAGASVDPLDPGLLYRRVDRLSGTSDGDGDDGEKTRVSSRRAAREAAERKSARLAVGLYHAALRALPAAVRVWFADLRDKNFARALASATASCVSPALLAAEFDAVERASKGNYGGGGLDDDAGELTIKASRGNREVVARYDIDDACLELVVRLPASYPLGAAELDCAKRVGISEARLRKWMLTVSSILQHQNGAVAEGLMLWRSNIDREFKGWSRARSATWSSTARTTKLRGSSAGSAATSSTARAFTSGSRAAAAQSVRSARCRGEATIGRVSVRWRIHAFPQCATPSLIPRRARRDPSDPPNARSPADPPSVSRRATPQNPGLCKHTTPAERSRPLLR